MELRKALLALEEPARQIDESINAVGIMVIGLFAQEDPYADGFHAIWRYLCDANEVFQKQLQTCLEFI